MFTRTGMHVPGPIMGPAVAWLARVGVFLMYTRELALRRFFVESYI